MSIFNRRQVVPGQAFGAQAVTLDSPVVKAKVREAYDRGRIEERRRNRGSPMLTLLLVLVAAVGAATLYYAFRQGSFMGGGAAMDTKIAQVSSEAAPAVQTAAEKAAALARSAGQKLGPQDQASQPTVESNTGSEH